MAGVLGFAVALLVTFGASNVGHANGVNVVNPQRLSLIEQDRILDELVDSKALAIRVPLAGTIDAPGDFGAATSFVIRAAKRGIRTTLNVFPQGEQSSRRSWDKRYPNLWGVFPLSKASPGLTASVLRDALVEFDRERVTLDGIEVGNEINFTAFNGDFPVPGSGYVYDLQDLEDLPELKVVAEGLRRYVEIVRAIRMERDSSRLNRNVPIISAGLADPGSKRRNRSSRVDAITIPATLKYLQLNGLNDVVDAYGIHAYPSRGEFDGEMLKRRVFGSCGAMPYGKPCWLTEWGFKSRSLACSSNDEVKAKAISGFAMVISDLRRQGAVPRDFYYQWNGSQDAFGIFRCGELVDGGKFLFQSWH